MSVARLKTTSQHDSLVWFTSSDNLDNMCALQRSAVSFQQRREGKEEGESRQEEIQTRGKA